MLCRHKDIYEVYIVNKENADFILNTLKMNYGKSGENPYEWYKKNCKRAERFGVSSSRYDSAFPVKCKYGYWDDKTNSLKTGYYIYKTEEDFKRFDNNEQNLLEKDIYSSRKKGEYFVVDDYSMFCGGYEFYTEKEFYETYELIQEK